ncbi:winged helix-turn-helix domain-containing protein, partial [Klebsiella pneumoniae]
DSRLLKLRNKDQLTIELSKPATRLLIELIKNNKNEMPRETLIKHVWEDYGFSPSSATLSNHISELRKAFEALGINKDILITVPRVGFKMEAEIHPETKNKELDTSTDGFGRNDITEDSVVQKKMIKKPAGSYGKKELHRVLKPILSPFFFATSALKWVLQRNGSQALLSIENKNRQTEMTISMNTKKITRRIYFNQSVYNFDRLYSSSRNFLYKLP